MTIINTTDDFIRLLQENEEFLAAARRVIYTQDLMELPTRFKEYALKTDGRLQSIEGDVGVLKEDVGTLKDDVGTLKEDVGVLKEDVGTLKDDVGVLKEDMGALKDDVGVLKEDMGALKDDVGVLKGDMGTLKGDMGTLQGYNLERKMHSRLRQRIGNELGLRRARPVWTARVGAQATGRAEAFENMTDTAIDDGLITDEEAGRLLDTDMVMSGVRIADGERVHIAVEASSGIRKGDIDRARKSASILQRLYDAEAIAVVYGYNIAQQQVSEAQADPVNNLSEVHIILETDRS